MISMSNEVLIMGPEGSAFAFSAGSLLPRACINFHGRVEAITRHCQLMAPVLQYY